MSQDIQQQIAGAAEQLKLGVGSLSFELVRISPGEFEMGSPEDEEGHLANEEPQRPIKISKAFYLGRYQVTQAQYTAIMGRNPSLHQGDHFAVDQVIYSNALEFCRRLTATAGVRVTLPTEAQWEFACRAGTTTRFYSGNTLADLARVAWFLDNADGHVHTVGQKPPNAWGLYDMHGNVWELCADFIPSLDAVPETDPVGVIHEKRGAMRGGGWMHGAQYCRSACRLLSNDRFGGTGLRIAINPSDAGESR
jgi:formylglycine-generating enzyme required for sulfatase activity